MRCHQRGDRGLSIYLWQCGLIRGVALQNSEDRCPRNDGKAEDDQDWGLETRVLRCIDDGDDDDLERAEGHAEQRGAVVVETNPDRMMEPKMLWKLAPTLWSKAMENQW